MHGGDCFRIVYDHATAWRGSHCIATRTIAVGEQILLEAPLCTTRGISSDDEAASTPLGNAEAEWLLTHALLRLGKRRDWASSFACGGRTAAPENDQVVAWLCAAHDLTTAEDALAVFECVRHNAFGLETPLLSVEYGSAFFEKACRFNHSCSPNCISFRAGGNMLIFACEPVAAGSELLHSYLPPRLLMLPRHARSAHLHFECECRRCRREPMKATPETSSLCFPPDHPTSDEGVAVGRFKLACASADHRTVLAEGDAWLPSLLETLCERPLAMLEIGSPYLSAFWSWRSNGGDDDGGGGGADGSTGRYAPLIARFACEACERLHSIGYPEGLAEGSQPCREGVGTAVALEQLHHSFIMMCYLLDSRPRQTILPRLFRSIQRLRSLCGGSALWLLDDMPLLELDGTGAGLLAHPPLRMVVEAVCARGDSPLEGDTLVDGLGYDRCGYRGCTRREEREETVGKEAVDERANVNKASKAVKRFMFCSACREVKYCSTACQRAAWSAHKPVCGWLRAPSRTPPPRLPPIKQTTMGQKGKDCPGGGAGVQHLPIDDGATACTLLTMSPDRKQWCWT
jgi:hypothetical protein